MKELKERYIDNYKEGEYVKFLMKNITYNNGKYYFLKKYPVSDN